LHYSRAQAFHQEVTAPPARTSARRPPLGTPSLCRQVTGRTLRSKTFAPGAGRRKESHSSANCPRIRAVCFTPLTKLPRTMCSLGPCVFERG